MVEGLEVPGDSLHGRLQVVLVRFREAGQVSRIHGALENSQNPLVDHAQRHIAPGHRLFIGAPGLGGGEIGLEGQAVLLLIHIEGIVVLVALALVLVLGELLRQLLQILRRRLGSLVPGGLDGPAEHLAETAELPRRLRLVVQLKGAVPVAPGGGTGHGEVPVAVLVSGIDRAEGDLEAEAGEQLQLFPAGGYSVDLQRISVLPFAFYITRSNQRIPYAGCIGSGKNFSFLQAPSKPPECLRTALPMVLQLGQHWQVLRFSQQSRHEQTASAPGDRPSRNISLGSWNENRK